MNPASPGPGCPRCGFPAALSPGRLEELASQSPMPASLRAGEPLLRRRLACCLNCDSLREQILCAQCGCFVRFRAAVLKGWCPSPAGDKWAALSEVKKPADTLTSAGGFDTFDNFDTLGEKVLNKRSSP